ncbi:sterile alpha motif domain-containing protein 9-like isoform X2 [Physella acuta]|uniref:sterile alpha motif domain-containing protein 9-like isoform X2 n=1 Tax=Physella acuta TaxID=109671 RepID=UPI0027DC80C1|nr:sterile alpha motif domain-containing protein 9-like isoform X2 [Physella acuta]
MNANQWEKVRHNWTELLKAYTSSTLAYLYQEGVINDDDRENINTARTSSQKMETLLFIIKRKIGKDPYSHLITILKEESPHLAEEIESTASSSQPNLSDPGNVFADSEEVRKVLRDHFTDGDDQNPVSLGEIRDTLKKEKAFSKLNEWSNPMLKDYLEKEFLNVEFQTSASSSGKNKRIVVKHIRRLSGEMQADQIMQPPVLDDTNPLYEHPRRFCADVDVTTKYVKGRCFDDVSSHVRDKKTTPIRNYHLVNQSQGEDEMLEFMGSKLIPFVSACMNERKNGTLYFGVCPKKDDTYRAGEIVGVTIDKDEVGKEIDNRLQTSFLNEQTKYTKAVRHPKFIPVVSGSSSTASWVVEIDVVPSISLLNNEVIQTKLHLLKMFAVSNKRQKREYGIFKFSADGNPYVLPASDAISFIRDISEIVRQRSEDEQNQIKKIPKSFNKLNRLLTGGSDQGKILDDIYIFFMLSPVDSYMDQDFLNKNMSFIRDLEPEVVFDFDPEGHTKGIYHTLDTSKEEIFNVYTLDRFNKESENLNSLRENLQKDEYTQWVFCNGYENMKPMDSTQWAQKRWRLFSEAFRAFTDTHGEERILLIICLFSKTYETMIPACFEALRSLPKGWILLSENEDNAKLWQDKILGYNIFEKLELDNKSVVDMAWGEINTTVSQITETTNQNFEVYLPCTKGNATHIPPKKLKEWHDIDILNSGDFCLEKKLEQMVEREFYCGEKVSWLNFWFNNQVLQRDIHGKLKDTVEDLLKGEAKDERKVQYITLLHEPGAGGTTAAMHVLWDLRTKYRCCRVKNIKENTSEHLEEIWLYKEDSRARPPRPLLVLIDYVDDDEYIKFKGKMEEHGRNNWKNYEESFDIFCVVIECRRQTKIRPPFEPNKIALLHSLSPREINWFKKDKSNLNNVHDLFAFNIMRENFNQSYISDVVNRYCDDIKENKMEIEILRIVAFFNYFSTQFEPIKVSWLDTLFKNRKPDGETETIDFIRDVKWEANLSSSIRFLMNISKYSRKKQPRKCLRIINKMVAGKILDYLKLNTVKKTSQIMLELCEPNVYKQTGQDADSFRKNIIYVARKRESQTGKKEKFSSFVTDVIKGEGADIAVKVLIQLYNVSKDAFIAQLISRVYMEMQNWKMAKDYAEKATSLQPENSFLWDTFGRVFSSELSDLKENDHFVDEDIIKIIKLGNDGLEKFQKAQEASEKEMTTSEKNNMAGYYGELDLINTLLDSLKLHSAFKEHSTLHKYLVEENYCPAELKFLDNYKLFLKGLASRARQGMRRLDEEYLQVKDGSGQEQIVADDYSRKNFPKLKANLDYYFEETVNAFEKTTMTGRDYCAYKLSYAQTLGASSLNQILELKKEGKFEVMMQIYDLLKTNMESQHVTFYDFKAILDVLTVLIVSYRKPAGLTFQNMLDWSKRFYFIEQPKESTRYYLEPMMYFVLYNFPTEERNAHDICPILDFKNALEKLRDQFKRNHPKQDMYMFRKKETTLFFLGNGSPLQDIVPQDQLEIMNDFNYKEKWNIPELRKHLRMMTGVLSNDGEKVSTKIITKDGNRFTLEISTAYHVSTSVMKNKKVYFYLGFSFSGPKAFGISLEELGTTKNTAHGESQNQQAMPTFTRVSNRRKSNKK